MCERCEKPNQVRCGLLSNPLLIVRFFLVLSLRGNKKSRYFFFKKKNHLRQVKNQCVFIGIEAILTLL